MCRSPGAVPAVRDGAPSAEEVVGLLKKLALAAVAAGALAAVRKRNSGGKAEADLWHEATRGPGAVSTPGNR